MRVARADRGDAIAVVQHGKPVVIELHDVRLHRGRGDDFQRVERVGLAAQVRAAHGVEMLRAKRREAGVVIARMVERDDAHAGQGAHRLHQLRPVAQLVVGQRAVQLDGEGVEVAGGRGDLVTDHRGEMPRRRRLDGCRLVIGVMIVVG